MIISKTPLRISFTGGGTDIASFYTAHEGAVISTTINKYIYVVVKRRSDSIIRVVTSSIEEVGCVSEVKHDLVREAMKKAGICTGIDIHIMADIPAEGTGLGSSSSVTVGLLNAFHAYEGRDVPPEELAEQACEIEIEVLKNPIGKQDQYAAALGGMRYYQFLTSGGVNSEVIPMTDHQRDEIERNLLLFYTGITRSASAILKKQGEQSAQNSDYLIRIKEQCSQLKRQFELGNHAALGVILDEGWELKKKLADSISNVQINEWYAAALQTGAAGGKIAGAGGGGFLMLYAEERVHSSIRDHLELQELKFAFDDQGTRIILQAT